MKLVFNVGKLEHGKEILGKVGRWCEYHKAIHGRFYACEKFPLEIKREIKKDERRHLQVSASYAILIIFTIAMILILIR